MKRKKTILIFRFYFTNLKTANNSIKLISIIFIATNMVHIFLALTQTFSILDDTNLN